MVLEAGQDKNITFRTKGSGTLNFVGHTGGGADMDGHSFVLAGLGGGGGRGLQQVQDRVARLEESVNADQGLTARLAEMDQRIQQLMVVYFEETT